MGSTLGAALWYAKQGWPIIPVWGVDIDEEGNAKCHCGSDSCEKEKGKHPVSYLNGEPIVPRGVKDATTNTETIKRWWSKYPGANIGGAATEWFALDIDRDEARYELPGKIPDTVEQISGSGGQHILFQHPKDWKVGNATGELPRGIDVRGCANDGSPHGYIILPPSMHKSGKRYEWEVSSHPRDVKIAKAPDWLLAILKKAQVKKVDVDIEDVAAPDLAVFDISKATRDRILNGHPSGENRSAMDMRVCCALVEASATPSEIAAIFHKYPIGADGKMADHNDPEHYLERTISAAFSWTTAKTPKKTIPSRVQPREMVTEEEAEYEAQALNLAYMQGWADALASNPAIMEVLWPDLIVPSVDMIKHYGMGVQMDYSLSPDDDREFGALVVPYYQNSEMAALDFILHEPPEDAVGRVWQTNGIYPTFDTEFDRSTRIEGISLVTADFDEAIKLQEMGFDGYDLLAQPATRLHPGQQAGPARQQRMQALADLLADSEKIILAWPIERKPEGRLLASLLEAGGKRVRWASMPADLRSMFKLYSMTMEQFKRILNMSSSVLS